VNRRRDVLVLLGAAALAPETVRPQAPAEVRRIGLLSPYSPSDTALWHQAFRLGLRDLGWVEGKNLGIEYRHAEGRTDRLPELAADLVRLKVDTIVAAVSSDALAARKATRAIPIVVASAGDPVESGLVDSLARPGGNVTGLTNIPAELAGKMLQLLKEAVPKLSRVAVLWNLERAGSTLYREEIQLPARQLGIQLHWLEVRSRNDFGQAFEAAIKARAGALFVARSPMIYTNLKRVADFAAKNRLPSIFHLEEFVDAGGLVAYGSDRADLYRRAATYVDKILRGAKPADLPVERPTKFRLAVNLKTAKAIGITIPQSVLFRADRVIE
jgi:putative tryptophan/tyrosine transport system substrate-binding protein